MPLCLASHCTRNRHQRKSRRKVKLEWLENYCTTNAKQSFFVAPNYSCCEGNDCHSPTSHPSVFTVADTSSPTDECFHFSPLLRLRLRQQSQVPMLPKSSQARVFPMSWPSHKHFHSLTQTVQKQATQTLVYSKKHQTTFNVFSTRISECEMKSSADLIKHRTLWNWQVFNSESH